MGKTPFYTLDNYRPERSLGYLIRRVHRAGVPLAEAQFDNQDMTFAQFIALLLIRDGLVDTAGGLARNLCHNTGATTRLIDQLEAHGLIRRARHGSDRRVVNLELTSEGLAAVSHQSSHIIDLWNDLLGEFAHEEIEMLISLLTRLMNRVEDVAQTRIGRDLK